MQLSTQLHKLFKFPNEYFYFEISSLHVIIKQL